MVQRTSGPAKGPQLPAAPQKQACSKCGAEFRWQASDPKDPASPLIAHLVKTADACDCGYGTGAPVLED